MTVWMRVPDDAGYAPGYMVSDTSRVMMPNGVEARTCVRTQGRYQTLNLRKVNGEHTSTVVHRLVCMAFHGMPPEGKPSACHYDGDSLNNDPANLRWASVKENSADADKHGTLSKGESHGMAKLVVEQVLEIRSLCARGIPHSRVASQFGVSPAQVRRIHRRERWKSVAEARR